MRPDYQSEAKGEVRLDVSKKLFLSCWTESNLEGIYGAMSIRFYSKNISVLGLPVCGLLAFAVGTTALQAQQLEVPKDMLVAFGTLPKVVEKEGNELTPAKINLGRRLYFEKRLSKNQQIACNSCHKLDNFGVDSEPTSPGHKGQRGGRNSPTVYNAAGHIAQFWDGRAADVEAQAKGPVLNPIEMAMPDEATVVATLKSIPGYVKLFKQVYPDAKDPVTYDNMANAIGAFERKLLTPGRFDQYLAGKDDALKSQEQQGLAKFMMYGCVTCHTGPYLGGDNYKKLGVVKEWPNLTDVGRFEVTKNEEDKYFFKVPSLRNIAKTGPYLHDGSVKDLPTMVRKMAEHQLGLPLQDQDVNDIVAFLKSLTGRVPAKYIAEPEPFPSGPKTPKAILD